MNLADALNLGCACQTLETPRLREQLETGPALAWPDIDDRFQNCTAGDHKIGTFTPYGRELRTSGGW